MYSHCGSVEWKSSENCSTYCKQPTRVPHSHFFLYEIFISLPMGSPLKCKTLKKEDVSFFLFFLRLLVLGFGETRMVYNGDILLLAAVMG